MASPSSLPPCALANFSEAFSRTGSKEVVVFLDYDGTLSPIVNDPDKALMSEEMRTAVNRVSARFKTSIISGRAVDKVKAFVNLDHLFYAGSHGLDIEGPSPTSSSTSGANVSHRPPGLDIQLVKEVREVLTERYVSVFACALPSRCPKGARNRTFVCTPLFLFVLTFFFSFLWPQKHEIDTRGYDRGQQVLLQRSLSELLSR